VSVDTDRLISFFILWGTPAVFSIVDYFKLSKTEKKEAIRDLISLKSIVTTGFILTGGVIASLGKLQAVISAASARYRYFYFSHWWCRGRY